MCVSGILSTVNGKNAKNVKKNHITSLYGHNLAVLIQSAD